MVKNGILGLILSCGLLASYADSLTDGLIAYFPFNGNAQDESGGGYTGVINGATLTSDRFGRADKAYLFDGTNDYITVDIPTLPTGTNSRTMTVWVFLSRPVTNDAVLRFVGYGAQNSNGQFGIGIYNYLRGQDAYLMQGYSLWKPNLPLQTRKWSFLAVTYSNNIVTMSLDGGSFTNRNNPLNTINNGRFFFGVQSMDGIQPGWSAGNWDRWFAGAIDDLRLYNRALSDAEVKAIYSLESAPQVTLIKALKPSFSNLAVGTNYQLQVSQDLQTWTDEGAPFTATNSSMSYFKYFDVQDWDELYFRLKQP